MIHIFRRRIAFHETDPMGVLHHANFVRILEEARVDWLRTADCLKFHVPVGDLAFAVVGLQIEYLLPVEFDTEIQCEVELAMSGIRFDFRYRLLSERGLHARARVQLAPLGRDLKPKRLPPELREKLARLSSASVV